MGKQSHPAQAMFAADRASLRLGIELAEVGDGTAVVRMVVRADMLNGHGIAHGGYVFLLAEPRSRARATAGGR